MGCGHGTDAHHGSLKCGNDEWLVSNGWFPYVSLNEHSWVVSLSLRDHWRSCGGMAVTRKGSFRIQFAEAMAIGIVPVQSFKGHLADVGMGHQPSNKGVGERPNS